MIVNATRGSHGCACVCMFTCLLVSVCGCVRVRVRVRVCYKTLCVSMYACACTCVYMSFSSPVIHDLHVNMQSQIVNISSKYMICMVRTLKNNICLNNTPC